MSSEPDLIARLEPFLRHNGLCAIVGGYGYCTCGLDAILTTLEASDADTVRVPRDAAIAARRALNERFDIHGDHIAVFDAALTATHPKPEPVETPRNCPCHRGSGIMHVQPCC